MHLVNDLYQNKFSKIISTALSQEKLNGIEEILSELAQSVGASGCILWESEPVSNFQIDPPTGYLYVFAKWFKAEQKTEENQTPIKIPLYKIPINGSANGYAIVNYKKQGDQTLMKDGVLSIKDAKDQNAPTHKENVLVEKLNVTSMCVVPICFDCREGNINASLAVYRDKEIKEFSVAEQQFIKSVAKLIPQLYEAICDKVGKRLLENTNEILDSIETKIKRDEWTNFSVEQQMEKIKKPLEKICNVIADAFQCIETSLFFENRFEEPKINDYRKQHNQEIKPIYKLFSTSFKDWEIVKKEYLLQKSEGLTAWTLVEKKPIRIFNLSTFITDKVNGLFDEEYKDVQWNDSLKFDSSNFKRKLREVIGLEQNSELLPDGDLPPLSFMAVPILRREELLGVIRCCMAKEDPWIFPDRHLRILERIAILISRFWNDYIVHLEDANETKSWEKLIEKINEQNKKVQGKIDRLDFSEKEAFQDILIITQKTFSDLDTLDIRLLDREKDELYFAEVKGGAWDLGSKYDRESRRNKRFSRNGKKIFAFDVIDNGTVKFISNIANESPYKSETFPQTRQMIIAPIGVAEKNIGILDIRRTTDDSFATNAPIMAELIGRQLGLYLELWETEKQQRQVFEDTWHQLKSPIRFIFARANALVDHEAFKDEPYIFDGNTAKQIVNELFMLRGVARKAHKVLVNAGIFAELATNQELKLIRDGNKLTSKNIRKTLAETIADTKLMMEDYRKVGFSCNYGTFERLDKIEVKVNFDYLEQAVNCLLDNADKYSYSYTTVKIYGGEESVENRRYFFIAVENEGNVIKEEEVEEFKRRKIRGESVKTHEGSGIGLWITDHIMKAHRGKLIILPTNLEDKTIVKLLFPILS